MTLNGMYAIMFRWILLICQKDASNLTMRILLQSYSRRNSLSVFLQLIIKQVKEDVLPFVRNSKELDIWSNDYFVQLAEMVRME